MTDLRKLARGQPCQVRLPGCRNDTSTVVLAHYRLSGICGAGLKPPDICGAWCCSHCHDISDGRTRSDMTRDEIRLAHADGVMRTLYELVRMGALGNG